MASARNDGYDLLVKLIVVGESGVGKSSLIHRYDRGQFEPHFVSTIGVDFAIKELTILDKFIKLHCWDCAGNERFRSITTSYYRGAQVILLVFDVNDNHSIDSIPSWLEEIPRYNNTGRLILVGNKTDLYKSTVPFALPERIQLIVDKLQIPMILTSAKENIKVEEAFTTLVAEFVHERLASFKKESNKEFKQGGTTCVLKPEEEKNSHCCP